MKKLPMILAALIGSALLFSALASAKPKSEVTAKQAAKQQCKAEKRADKAAFKATYGKRAMRTCVKGEKSESSEEIRNAAQECKAERAADPDAFTETYGGGKQGKNAHGKCVSSKVKAEKQEDVSAFKNAAKECKAERDDLGRDAFKEQYGSNKNGKNALGKCVSSKVEGAEDVEEEPEAETTS
jgi:hypothetical protein